jgi:hypothetical protein
VPASPDSSQAKITAACRTTYSGPVLFSRPARVMKDTAEGRKCRALRHHPAYHRWGRLDHKEGLIHRRSPASRCRAQGQGFLPGPHAQASIALAYPWEEGLYPGSSHAKNAFEVLGGVETGPLLKAGYLSIHRKKHRFLI